MGKTKMGKKSVTLPRETKIAITRVGLRGFLEMIRCTALLDLFLFHQFLDLCGKNLYTHYKTLCSAAKPIELRFMTLNGNCQLLFDIIIDAPFKFIEFSYNFSTSDHLASWYTRFEELKEKIYK